MKLEQLCQEYVINIYNTIHEGDINYKLALASERRDLHNLILAKLGVHNTLKVCNFTPKTRLLKMKQGVWKTENPVAVQL